MMIKQNINCSRDFSPKRLLRYLLPFILFITIGVTSANEPSSDNDTTPTDILSNGDVSSSKFEAPKNMHSSQSTGCDTTDCIGIISTIAGVSINGYSGDGGPATAARIAYPHSIAIDKEEHLYISERFTHRIRQVDLTTGIITTFAGTGVVGYNGDGGLAIDARFNQPGEIVIDHSGNLYIAEIHGNRIRKIDTHGIITTIAGNGIAGYSGDGGPATQARINEPTGMAIDNLGNLYFSSSQNHRVRKVDTNGIITTVAGVGVGGYSGDGNLATEARLNHPNGLAIDHAGHLYIADGASDPDEAGGRIRKIDTHGIITTIAGDGTWGDYGDGGPATQAQFSVISNLTFDQLGNLYLTDQANHRVRRIDTHGIITTVAGDGTKGFNSDGKLATETQLNFPTDIIFDSHNNLYIADGGNQYRNEAGNARIFKVTYFNGEL
jgi:sugar lactone lactonase YvrE